MAYGKKGNDLDEAIKILTQRVIAKDTKWTTVIKTVAPPCQPI